LSTKRNSFCYQYRPARGAIIGPFAKQRAFHSLIAQDFDFKPVIFVTIESGILFDFEAKF